MPPATPAAPSALRALFYHPGGRWCGEARAFVAAARGLSERGWAARLATSAGSPAYALARAAGVEVTPLAGGDSFLGAVAELTRAVRDARAEAVFAHGDRGHHVAAASAWRAGGACVVRRVPAGASLPLGSPKARAALRSAPTGFLCTWTEQAESVPARLRERTVVADLGAPAAGRASPNGALSGLPDDAFQPGRRIVCILEPSATLRAATALRAAARLAPRHGDLEVVLAGPGAGDEGLRLHAAALGVVHRVRIHDPARDGEAAPPLAGAAVAWVVADGDDGAFGALDAMAAGIPVLADRGSVAARYVADAITGLHLTPGDVASTAAALAPLLANADTRRGMGAAGRARAARHYTEAAMLDGFARAAAAARARARVPG